MGSRAGRAAALALCLGLLGLPASAAPDTGAQPASSEPATVKTPQRFQYYVRSGLPAEYRGKTNPYQQPTVPIVIKGADLYNVHCASCHGMMGFGNGAAGGGLRVKPADLAWSLSSKDVKDDFLFWTISEGGAQFGSNMPAFKGTVKDYQIWEMITYMRAAFEGREASVPAPIKQAMADR